MAHLDYVCVVMMTKLLGLESKLMEAELISKKKFVTSPMARMVSPWAESDLGYKGK